MLEVAPDWHICLRRNPTSSRDREWPYYYFLKFS